MSRIELTDTTMDAIIKMAEGNPGAVQAIMGLMSEAEAIDPQSALGSMGPIFLLDNEEIYGSAIYVLANDQCGRDVRKFIMLLRAVQLGLFSHTRLKALSEDQSRQDVITEEEWAKMDEQVCEQLTEFQRAA